jgi:hypothetical protein
MTRSLTCIALLGTSFACNPTLDPVRGQRLPDGGLELANPVEPDEVGADVVLTVRSDRELVAISPRIYGINGRAADDGVRPRLVRFAGNRWSAYNWENNASNAGEYFEFQNDAFLSDSDEPGAAVTPALDAARTLRGTAVITIPILDHVAADKLGGGDVRESGADWLETRFQRNLPSNPDGTSVTPDTTDGAVYQADYIAWVRAGYEGTDVLFTLDAEPELWHETHPTLQPEPLGYDQLVDRTVRFARAAKTVWPAAEVIGLGASGWSAWESLAGRDSVSPDAGKGPLLDYWLSSLAQAERDAGERLVDHADLHWTSEARGAGVRVVEADDSAEVVAARVQAPRSLWDPSYVEDSWVTDTATRGEPVRLIPRILERIARTYPGTGLAICEWEFGGGEHISGALAAADALGAFGRYGVSVAAHRLSPGSYVRAAFSAFMDFDGGGARFGDTAVTAVSDDIAAVSVYASFDWGNQERVVVLVINKQPAEVVTGLRIAHPARFASANTWLLDDSGPTLREGEPLFAVGTNAFRWTVPAHSLTIVVPAAE